MAYHVAGIPNLDSVSARDAQDEDEVGVGELLDPGLGEGSKLMQQRGPTQATPLGGTRSETRPMCIQPALPQTSVVCLHGSRDGHYGATIPAIPRTDRSRGGWNLGAADHANQGSR
jgi:hypothetical protein